MRKSNTSVTRALSAYPTLIFLIGFMGCMQFVNAQNTLNRLGLSSATPAAGAFSLRKLSTTYAGAAIKVRRASDGVLFDIGYLVSGELDTFLLKTLIGSSSGFVQTWYDQSGYARHATQGTAASQPRIVNAGQMEYSNGRPAVVFSGGQTLQTGVTAAVATTAGNITTASGVFRTSITNGSLFGNGAAVADRYNVHAPWGDGITYWDLGDAGSTGRISVAGTWSGLSVGTFQRNGSEAGIWKNGASIISSTTMGTTASTSDNIWIGSMTGAGNYLTGVVSELIFFPSALSTANRQLLECNQSGYYNIAENIAPVITCASNINAGVAAGTCASPSLAIAAPAATDNCTGSGVGAGLQFNGTTDYISFTNDLSTVTNFTYEAWVNQSANQFWQRILDFGRAPGQNIFFTTYNSFNPAAGYPRFAINLGAGEQIVTSTTALPLNQWVHLAVTLDGSTARLYMNGTLVGTTTGFTFTPASLGATTNNWIGRSQYAADGYYVGRIDDVRMWNVTRTQAQIQANMNAELAPQTGLIAYYRMNQGTIEGNNAGKTTLLDYSCNGRNGTLNSFALTGNNSNYVTGAPVTASSVLGVFNSLDNACSLNRTFPTGTTSITWTAYDASGNTATCVQTVTVNDDILPTISCPANSNVTVAGCTASVATANPVTGDNCGVTRLTWSMSGATVAASAATGINNIGTYTFNTGVTNITYTVADAAGNSATCNFTVTVNENVVPVISGCSSNITVTAGTIVYEDFENGTAGWSVGTNETDPATGRMLGRFGGSGGAQAVSRTFTMPGTGAKTVSFDLYRFDSWDNENFTVYLNDAPVAVFNPLFSTSGSTLTVSWTATIVRTITPNAFSGWGDNVVRVTLNINDANATCKIGFGCALDQAISDESYGIDNFSIAYLGGPCVTNISFANPVTSDNCGVTSLTWATTGATVGASPLTGINNIGTYSFNGGVTTVTYTAKDASGNTATCSFTVTVTSALPVITCPGNISVRTGTIVYEDFEAGASGWSMNTTEYDANTSRVLGRFAGSAGAQAVSKTFIMPGTATKIVSFDLYRLDSWDGEAFRIFVNNTQVASYSPIVSTSGTTGAVSWTSTVIRTISPNAFSGWSDQLIRVVLTITDGNPTCKIGFGSTLDQAADDEAYAIDNFSISYAGGAVCGTTLAVSNPAISTACGLVNSLTWSMTGATVASSPASGVNYIGNFNFNNGTTTINYNLTDGNGVSTSCSFNIAVADNSAPVITGPANVTGNTSASSCTASINAGSPVVTDDCGVTKLTWAMTGATIASSPATGINNVGTYTFNIGTTTITYTAVDAGGNTSTGTQTVTVADATPPVVVCPADITVNANAGLCGAVVNYTVTATDNCDAYCNPGTLAGFTLVGTYNGHVYYKSTASAIWPTAKANAIALGAHLVTISSSGENAFLSGVGLCWAGFTDEAVDGTWVWCNGEPVVYTSWAPGQPDGGTSQNYMALNWSGTNWDNQGTATATALPYIIEFDCLATNLVTGLPSGSLFPVGINTVTYNAIDAAGNASTPCSFTVTVVDNIAPTFTCPSNITVTAAAGACTAVVNYTTPVAVDNCGTCSTPPTLTGMTSLGTRNGSAYYVSNAAFSWTGANLAAVNYGGYLAAIESAGENTFILNAVTALGIAPNYWIGLNDSTTEGTYVWRNGQTISFINWGVGQPDNSGGVEDYVHVYNAFGQWNDLGAGSALRYILELPCVPVTRTAGLASGADFPVGTTTVTHLATDAAGNTANCSFTVTVNLNASSINKTVTASPAAICSGAQTNVTVALSNTGVNYQLRDASNTNIGSAVAGTGGTISLPTGVLTATTTFNVLATHVSGGCSYSLTNTATVTVNALPALPTAGDNSRCGTGTVTITATPAAGQTIDWYTASTGGTAVLAGNNSYTTPSISATTTYYAQARNTTTGCVSPGRTAVTATVNALPALPTAGDNSRCGSGTVTISATPGTNETIDWYAAASGGAALLTGNTAYTTPSIAATTIYHAQARNITTGCLSATRRGVTATINTVPALPTAGNSSRCGSGTVTITATPGAGQTIDWYDAATGGTILLSGNTSYTTPSISSTTVYYAEARNTTTGCTSATRTAVTATVNTTSLPTAGDNSRCGTGTVVLTATPGAGETIDWYAASTGGTALLTGNTSYTTPSITSTTVYYAQARNTTTGCVSATRTAVTATINALPSAPAAGNNSRCGAGTVTITATPGAGETIDWYAASTGGTALLSGNTSYTTPSITATTIYYAAARNTTTGCVSATRTAVTATVNSLPVITAQSTAAATYCLNATATAMSVTATGTGVTYQWFVNTVASNASGSAINGATAATYTPSTATVGTFYYYCTVSGTCTPAVKSTISGAITINGSVIAYNTPGTYVYTVPAGVTQLNVQVWGAGGSGSKGFSGYKGTGGGGGGFAQRTLTVTPGNVINIAVGQGGAGATVSGNGNSGGTSSIVLGATTVSATGGGGGITTSTPTGTGGTAGMGSGGTINFSGGTGANINLPFDPNPGGGGGASGGILSNGFNAGNTIPGASSAGGTAVVLGGAGANGSTTLSGDGLPGGFPGGGGGGNSGAGSGGSGADGRVIISIPVSISYSSAAFCKSVTSATPTILGASGGTFAATPAGLTISNTTGVINPSTSTVGTYTVTYTNSCGSATASVIISGPSLPTAGNNSRCGTGAITINATPASGETIDWYAAATGGTALLSGNTSYAILSLATTTTYYAEARNTTTGCVSATRTAVTGTVNPQPVDKTLSAIATTICTGTSATIQVPLSQSGVTYQLRNNAGNINIGSAVAGTGAAINLPSGALASNTTFNVLATITASGCAVQMGNTIAVTVTSSGLWIGGATGDWNTSSNWCGGVPTGTTDVTIPAGVTVNIQSANAVAKSISITATGSLVMTGAHNLSIPSGGTFTNNGTFNATGSTGTVAFLGGGTISGTTTFKNIDAYGALDFGTASTIAGTFSLQTGGSVAVNSPTYTCPTAVLAYKPGATFNRGLEWTTSPSGAGYPANVVVQNNTTVNFPAGGNGSICYDLQIDAGSSLKQNFGGGSASLRVGRNVTISGTLELGDAAGGDISLGGNWTRNTGGVFNANDRKVTFDGTGNFSGNGTTMSTITAPSSSAKDNEGGFGGEKFAHIWINKTNAADSVVLLSNITVTRELGFTKGTFSLRNSDVTLVSNSSRTADVAPVTSTADVSVRYAGTGKFAVQRYIPNPTSTRSWRLVTAPLQGATAPSINQAYMYGVVNPNRLLPNANSGAYNPWPGYGVHITGPGGAYSAANGFDHGTSSSSIMYSNGTSWLTPSSTISTKVTDQQGWMLFVRGDRGFVIGNQYTPAQNTILEPKGRINIGDVTVAVSPGRQVMGNPYPSAISLLNIDVAGTAGKWSNYHVWDPKMFTSYTQPGKWVSFSGLGSSFVKTTSASAYPSNGTIESGQAFLLDIASAGTVTFHESDKLALTSSLIGISNSQGARPMDGEVVPMFRTDIYAKTDTSFTLTDAVLNVFHASFDNAANDEDAKKFISFNTKESMSILRDSMRIAIEKRTDLQRNDTIFLAMARFNEIPYRFRFEATDIPYGYEAFLEDNFTNARTPLSTDGVSEVNINFTANPLSKAENRFRIVFKSTIGVVLPVTFTGVKAWQQNSDIAVQWKVDNQLNIRSYEVEKSLDGVSFTKVNSTFAQSSNSGTLTYNWLDVNAVTGANYYRIRSIGTDNSSKLSTVVKVNITKAKGSITVYPNPVTDNVVHLKFAGMEQGTYQLRLLNAAGQVMKQTSVSITGSEATSKLQLDKGISKGTYDLEIFKPDNTKTVTKVMVQ